MRSSSNSRDAAVPGRRVISSGSGFETMRTVHVRIDGRVQGVGYRAWTARTATELGLAGWVRNRRDGSVEAVFQGPADVVDAMVRLARTGPRYAAVEQVEVIGEGVGVYDGFEVLATE